MADVANSNFTEANDFDFIEINTDLVPYEFDIDIEEERFGFDIRYNDIYDFYTIDLYKDDVLLKAGEKLVYGQPLFPDTLNAPAPTIIPLDPAGIVSKVGKETLGVTVFLVIDNGPGGALNA